MKELIDYVRLKRIIKDITSDQDNMDAVIDLVAIIAYLIDRNNTPLVYSATIIREALLKCPIEVVTEKINAVN